MKTPIAAPTRLSRLIQLNAQTSDLMEFRMLRDLTPEEQAGIDQGRQQADEINDRYGRPVLKATAAGAGLVGAGFIGQRAVNKAGGYRAVAKKATDAGARTVDYAGKIGTQFKYARSLGGTLGSKPIDIAKDFLKRAKGVRFASPENVIRLNAVLDEVIEFKTDEGHNRRVAAGSAALGVSGGYLLGRRSGYLLHSPEGIKRGKAMEEAMDKAIKRSKAQGQGVGATLKRITKAGWKAGSNVRLAQILDDVIKLESK